MFRVNQSESSWDNRPGPISVKIEPGLHGKLDAGRQGVLTAAIFE